MTTPLWVGFLLVVALLALDLGVFQRGERAVSIKEALAWSAFWIVLALAFNVLVFALYEHRWLGVGAEIGHPLSGRDAALQFFTSYLVAKSLSVDNIFVIAMIFAFLGMPLAQQHRVLFWGIVGALVLRGMMIAAGAATIARWPQISYLFGALLIATAVKLVAVRHDNLRPERDPLVRLVRRFFPAAEEARGRRFFVRQGGRLRVTPPGIALAAVQSSAVLFAVDAIPAILAVTRDPFLVFTSNVFALLGLRSLYFALAGIVARLRYLKISLAFLLAFIGVKMLLATHYPIPVAVVLAVAAACLSVGVIASIVATSDTAALESPLADELERLTRIGLRQARRIAILIIGSTVVLIGMVMIFLPGPGSLVIPAGLSILALEFVWARRWLAGVKDAMARVSRTFGARKGAESPDGE